MDSKKTNSKTANQAQKPGKPTGKDQRTQVERIDKPMIPGTYMRMLRQQGTDKDVDHVQVKFYPKGLYDILIAVQTKDGLKTMTSGQFQAYRNTLEPQHELAQEVEAAQAFFKKLESRCWIKSGDHSPANARRVKAIPWPAIVASAMDLTQKDIKSKKLTPARMFAIWKEMDSEAKKLVGAFQAQVDPGYDWITTLATYSTFMERTKREEEEKKKKVTEEIRKDVLQSTNWGDVEEIFKQDVRLPLTTPVVQPLVDNPFMRGGNGPDNHEDEKNVGPGGDPLDRPLSPKPGAGEANGEQTNTKSGPPAKSEEDNKKKGLLSAFMGTKKPNSPQGQEAQASQTQ